MSKAKEAKHMVMMSCISVCIHVVKIVLPLILLYLFSTEIWRVFEAKGYSSRLPLFFSPPEMLLSVESYLGTPTYLMIATGLLLGTGLGYLLSLSHNQLRASHPITFLGIPMVFSYLTPTGHYIIAFLSVAVSYIMTRGWFIYCNKLDPDDL